MDTSTLIVIFWRGVITGSLSLGVGWIVFSVTEFIWRTLLRPFYSKLIQYWFSRKMRYDRQLQNVNQELQQQDLQISRDRKQQKKQEAEQAKHEQQQQLTKVARLRRQLHLELRLLYDTHRDLLLDRINPKEFETLLTMLEQEEAVPHLRRQFKQLKQTMEGLITNTSSNDSLINELNKDEQIKRIREEFDHITEQLSILDEETRQAFESELHDEKNRRIGQVLFGK